MRRVVLMMLFALTALGGEPQLIENVVTRGDAAQSYTVFLPSSFDPKKQHPILLVLDPRGRGTDAANIFRDAAEQFGWVLLSSNGTRSDGDPTLNDKALRALVPEIPRYAPDSRRIYATGFSGTAMVSWALGIKTNLLAGVIGVGGRRVKGLEPEKFSFAHYGFAGERDFNNRDMRAIDAELDRVGKVHRFAQFDAPHRWITPELAIDALGWFEIVAMNEGKRTRDDALIARLYDREVAALKTARPLDSLRMHGAIVQTYESLRDVSQLRARLEALQRDPAVRAALDAEQRWDRFEEQYQREVLPKVAAVHAAMRQNELTRRAAHISEELRIADLQRRAKLDDAEGLAARRLLESVYGQLAFYLLNRLIAQKEYAIAVPTLTVAASIHPENWTVWYNLGAMQARTRDHRRALESLEKAISAGFKNAKFLEADEDYEPLRENERFKSLLNSIK